MVNWMLLRSGFIKHWAPFDKSHTAERAKYLEFTRVSAPNVIDSAKLALWFSLKVDSVAEISWGIDDIFSVSWGDNFLGKIHFEENPRVLGVTRNDRRRRGEDCRKWALYRLRSVSMRRADCRNANEIVSISHRRVSSFGWTEINQNQTVDFHSIRFAATRQTNIRRYLQFNEIIQVGENVVMQIANLVASQYSANKHNEFKTYFLI